MGVPSIEGPLHGNRKQRDPGPYRLTLSTSCISSTTEVLTRRGVPFWETPEGLDINPEAASGVRIRISSG